MKKSLLLVFLLSVSFAFSQQLVNTDTVWTRDLWKTGTINQVQFLPDGRSVAVATGAGVSVFDVNTGDLIKRFDYPVPGNNNPCNSFVITEDRSKLITSHNDATVIVWDWEKGDTINVFRSIAIFNIKLLNVTTLIGIGTGDLPVTIPDSTKLILFDFSIGKILNKISPSASTSLFNLSLSMSNSTAKFAISTWNNFNTLYQIELWDMISLKKVTSLGTHNSVINDLAFSSDGKYLASASDDGNIKVWDVQEKKLIQSLKFDDNLVTPNARYVRFSHKSGYLIAGGGVFGKLSTKIWKIPTFEMIYEYVFGATYGLDISPDSTYIGVGSGNQIILLNSHWTKTDVKEQPTKSIQVLYPSPAGNQITIPIEHNIEKITVTISNSTGQILKTINQLESISPDLIIDISGLPTGIYFVSVLYPSKTETYKFEKGL